MKGIIERHRAAQRLLSPLAVVIPFAERLAEKITSDRVEVRRAYPLLMSAIQASALLYQRQRSLDADGRLIAEADDYKLVRHLLAKPMTRTLGGGLSEPARRFYERLRSWAPARFTTSEVKRHEAGSERAAYGWLVECQRFGLLDAVEQSRGPKPAVWELATDGPDPSGCPALPPVDELFPAGMTCTLARKAQVQSATEG